MDMNTDGTTNEPDHDDLGEDQQREELIERIDMAARAVASHMPFPVELNADMGGTFALQLDLGTPLDEDDPDDSHETAGIDPDDPTLRWWYNADGGEHTVRSPYGPDALPEDVARWIVQQAARPDQPSAGGRGPMARARAARAGLDPRPETSTASPAITASPLER